jgi:peptide deformylase
MMPQSAEIVTIDSPKHEVLRTKTEDIKENELPLAKEIAEALYASLKPHMPAAGLAAPQIGISKSVFIFSYDRDPKNLEVVINPTFAPVGSSRVKGWEGCFSVLLCKSGWKLAYVPRYETILVSYLNLNGERIEKTLEGFAAKVFQHEFDHLQGIECIDRPDAITKSFDSKEELLAYLQEVKKEDSTRYIKPK